MHHCHLNSSLKVKVTVWVHCNSAFLSVLTLNGCICEWPPTSVFMGHPQKHGVTNQRFICFEKFIQCLAHIRKRLICISEYEMLVITFNCSLNVPLWRWLSGHRQRLVVGIFRSEPFFFYLITQHSVFFFFWLMYRNTRVPDAPFDVALIMFIINVFLTVICCLLMHLVKMQWISAFCT